MKKWTIEIRVNGSGETIQTIGTDDPPGSKPYYEMMQQLKGKLDWGAVHVIEPAPRLQVRMRR